MRETWLDYSRAYACILVTVGHLIMGLLEAAIIPEPSWASAFVDFIYLFHVYIFFFCGGYLFQHKAVKWTTTGEMLRYKAVRCFDLLVPYVFFTAVTYVIKAILSTEVNSQLDDSFIHTLLISPINQMWYLYAAAVIGVIAPPIRSKHYLLMLGAAALLAKVLTLVPAFMAITPLRFLLENLIWYVLGMIWRYCGIRMKPWMAVSVGIAFVGGAFAAEHIVSNRWIEAILTLLGIISSVEVIRILSAKRTKTTGIWKWISKYMLQIYLLHTICAAGIRIILLRLGMKTPGIHLVAGAIFSFVIPVLCAMIAERIRMINFVFFPSKTIAYFASRKHAA